MQVDLTLDVEKALPLSIQNKLVRTEELIYPNIDKGWSFWSFWSVKSPTQGLKSQVVWKRFLLNFLKFKWDRLVSIVLLQRQVDEYKIVEFLVDSEILLLDDNFVKSKVNWEEGVLWYEKIRKKEMLLRKQTDVKKDENTGKFPPFWLP